MGVGKLFLASISSGVITLDELQWIARNQLRFSRCEQAAALKLGYLLDSGQLSLGCRL
ncbi:hypothetical protein [Prochlorococcus marinus]|uniref:Protein family PM-15 n=1 Tax=Prochlorococcus marinus (strain MIT 9211) TaxID=93059 RepID=A9BC81_PROM4|nr:hypothetical protein [Prochlorococcus marinus]ABX09443.1 Hypothetical protein P9211_15121 [Prochlorococcus marinus str. MIT 9211]